MKSNNNCELTLELLESVEEINTLIGNQDRQIAVMSFNSLEKRIMTLQSVYPKTHIISQIMNKIYVLHVSELYQELEADIERYEKHSIVLEVPKDESLIYQKYLAINERGLSENMGSIFEPETAKKLYGVNFLELEFKKHYDVFPSVSIGVDIQPILTMHFTDEGIKELLKTNQKMIDEVERLYLENMDEV